MNRQPRGICMRLGLAWLLFASTGCSSFHPSVHTQGLDPESWNQWKAKRHESIAGTYGWASLAGLHWLPEGTSWVGTAPSNQIVLDAKSAPAVLGRFHRTHSEVVFEPNPAASVRVGGKPAASIQLVSDIPGPPSLIEFQGLRMVLIQRGEKGERLGLRLRDPNTPARRHFLGLDYFTYNPAWRLTAHFEPHPSPQPRRFSDVTGGIEVMTSPGTLVFNVQGKEFRLDAVEDTEEKDLFILFRDKTSGHSTYGSGRFIHAPKPDAAGNVLLDFNFAYNPPCAFTPYATCPIPPRQNALPLAIEAGEHRYRGGH